MKNSLKEMVGFKYKTMSYKYISVTFKKPFSLHANFSPSYDGMSLKGHRVLVLLSLTLLQHFVPSTYNIQHHKALK